MKRTYQAVFNTLLLLSSFFSSCKKEDANGTDQYDIIYVESNDFHANQNSVLAFRHNSSTNVLEQISGSPFLTNGAGVGNPMQLLGPSDSDFELKRSADGKYVLAVNSGSNTIAVFAIHNDGTLTHVSGSPFPSGGETPVSIEVSGNKVFVVNKSQNPLVPTTTAPNYTTFTIDGNGRLMPVAGAMFETTIGSSPSQALISKNGHFVFGDDFLAFMLPHPMGTLRSFNLASDGRLTAVAGTPYTLPIGMMPDNGALGLWQHPSGNPLYVGIPIQGKIGVFTVNETSGALSMQATVAAGKAACWIRTDAAGHYMYVLNSGDNTIQSYNLANPMLPVSIQTLTLKNSGPVYPGPGGVMFKTSEPFSLHFSSDENMLYVVNQHTNADFSIGNFNFLHTVKVNDDGTMSEPTDPIQLPVPNTVRPKGSLVIRR